MPTSGERAIMTVNFLLDLTTTDCVQIVMQAVGTAAPDNVRLLSTAASGTLPGVPSMITNIWRIG